MKIIKTEVVYKINKKEYFEQIDEGYNVMNQRMEEKIESCQNILKTYKKNINYTQPKKI